MLRTATTRSTGRALLVAALVAAAMAMATTAPAAAEDGPVVVDDRGLAGDAVRARAAEVTTAAATPMCIGDGSTGKRVQLWYVRRPDQPSRLAEVAPQMQEWATQIDRMLLEASRSTGKFRRVRWATGPDCVPTVREHVVADTVTDFGPMLVDLSDAGLRPPDRKLLIAADFGGYCGFGEVQTDDRPGPENLNNTQPYGLGGAVGEFCWGFPAAAHELFHTLGAVQESAPNATPGRHCTDEYDLMCYADGSTTDPIREVCPRSQNEDLDCGGDDYFNANPPAGSYLATHWNTAQSGFLDRSAWFLPPDRPENPRVTVGTASATVTWEAPLFDGGSPVTSYVVTAHPSGRVVTTDGAARSVSVTGLADGEVVWFTVQARSVKSTGPASLETEHRTPTPTIWARPFFTGEDPSAVAASPAGNTYVGTKGGLVKVDVAGKRSKVASSAGTVVNPPVEGIAVGQTPIRPVGVAVHPTSGDLYVSDRLTNRVRRITAGRVYTVAGGGPAIVPEQLAFDPAGNLYITEPTKHRVWKRATDGRLTVFAGSPTGAAGFGGDGGPATAALLRAPSGVAADPAGNVYVADRNNHRVRRIDAAGTITTFAGNGADVVIPDMAFDGTEAQFLLLPRPRGIAWGDGRLFVQSAARVVAITPDTLHVTYVGSPARIGDSGDRGPARDARIGDDVQLATWGGRLVVLDLDVDRLRQVAPPAPARP